MRLTALLVTIVLSTFTNADEKISLADAAEHAVAQSKLTLQGSKAFHLKAEIIETTNPKSEYRAKIEQYWVSPVKWRRTIDSPDFLQTLIVNGDQTYEQDRGDYFPWWLNDLVTAMVNPLPMVEDLKRTNSQIARPRGSENSSTCADLRTKIDRWVFCFEGAHGLLKSVIARGYDADFSDFKSFGGKRVARRIVIDPEPGTTIEARITELSELSSPNEEMFFIQSATSPAGQIKSLRIDEDTFRKLTVTSTNVDWPPAGGGAGTGGCAVYVSADRTGHVQEAWPHGCDNPGLQDPLRDIVKKWQLKPATENGVPVQVESLLTFKFETKIVKPEGVAELSDAEARSLAANPVEPVFPRGSTAKETEIIVRVSVDETGKLAGVSNPGNLKTPVFLAVYQTLGQWKFKPYLKDGKPQYFHANIIFHAKE